MKNLTYLLRVMSFTCLLVLAARGQTPATAHLVIDSENTVFYVDDVTDLAKLATSAGPVPPEAARNFTRSINIGDIVSVNGEPARGAATGEFSTLTMRTNPTPGQAIADIPSGTIAHWTYTILSTDGDPVGSIMMQGLGFAPKPPGSPAAALAGDFAIIGGTGAFVGVRGQAAFAPLNPPPGRFASVTEDPANRRWLGGGSYRLFLNVIADRRPTVVATQAGPAIAHPDGSLVTPANPARSGEVLSALVTGLGLDQSMEIRDPIAESRFAKPPIQVSLNGVATDVSYTGGSHGGPEVYKVSFTVPSGIGTGSALFRWSVAWIPGNDIAIAIR